MTCCARGGLYPFEWQEDVLEGWLAVKGGVKGGTWAAKSCGLSVPRQNGKSLGVLEARMNYGALALGEQIIYTAHLQKTATETFEDMRAFFEHPKMRKYVKEIKTALGREQIILRNPRSKDPDAMWGRIKFLARTRNGGRGQHGDLLVFDEAQELTDEQQGSFLPAISASANPQTIYAGTPPDENADGTVFRRIRADALGGQKKSIAWSEWSVDDIGNIADRARWYATNPSLGITLQETTVEGEFDQMVPDKFARERLGWWSSAEAKEAEHVISAKAWEACKTDNPPADGLMACGVKFAADGASVSLAVALKPQEGLPYVEVVSVRSVSEGVSWLASWLAKRQAKIAAVAIDGRVGASALTTRLAEVGFPAKAVVSPGAAGASAAVSMFVNAVNEHAVEHFGDEATTKSATLTTRRQLGRDGFGFESTEDADSTLIEACCLAFWQVMTTKRRPGRKALVW